MPTIRLKNLNDEEAVVSEDEITGLRSKLRGQMLLPSDPGYDTERSIWNGMIDKKPGLIILCLGASDVIHAVNFAKEKSILVSVRGGGHNVAGNSICDGGLMISLAHMKGITVDLLNKTVTAQPGANWGDLDKETQVFEMAVPGGIVSTTGISGFTLGGGFGWISRKYGLAADNLISADVVTADGKFLTASEKENKDLFWGIRGGGGNFGIITSFKFKLNPLKPELVSGLILYEMKDAPEVINFFREFTKNSPEELTSLLLLRLAPPAPFLPKEVHGKPVCGIVTCYSGDIEDGKKIVEPLKKFGNPIVDLVGAKPFISFQSMFDAGQASGNCYYWNSEYFNEINDNLAKTLIENADKITSGLTGILLFQLGGKTKSLNNDETSAGSRDAEFILNINACWVDKKDSEKHIKWTKEFCSSVKPYSTGGVYVNFLSEDEGEDRTKAAYKENYDRLLKLKKKYDPQNFFRLNRNISPS